MKDTAVRKMVDFKDLYLDPNNPRIRTFDNAKKTKFTDIKSDTIQKRTRELMISDAATGIQRHAEMLVQEGFNPHYAFYGAELPGGGVVINDGNTRFLSIEHILSQVSTGKMVVSPERLQTLRTIPVYIIGEYGGFDWLQIQKKNHIEGARTWMSSRRANWEIEAVHNGTLSAEQRKVLLGSESIRQRRSLEKVDMYMSVTKQFPGRLTEKSYGIFKEVQASPAAKKYLGWDKREGQFTNKKHVSQLVELIDPRTDGKRRMTVNNASVLRALGSNPSLWQRALDKGIRDKYLANLQVKETSFNELLQRLGARLENLKTKETENLDIEVASDVVSKLQAAQRSSKRLAVA